MNPFELLELCTKYPEVIDVLNKQSEQIKELEKENETLKDTIDGLTDTLAHTIDITPCGDVK